MKSGTIDYQGLMRKVFFALIISVLVSSGVSAQDNEEMMYRRSSIYSLMIKHDGQQFANQISDVFLQMPVPDKYNDHDLSVKVILTDDKKNDRELVETFLGDNGVASRLVAKWFNRDITNGVCDVELIKERGIYGISEADKAEALQTLRGSAAIEDAGLELIGSTFVLVNDIRYVDKATTGKIIGGVLRVAGSVAAAYTGDSSWSDAGDSYGEMAESLKGFKVKIVSHLFQLVWDEEAEGIFYEKIYTEEPDPGKLAYMASHRGEFRLKYIGSQESSGRNVSFLGISEDEPHLMVRKACQRALDENVMNLQKNFEAFKVKVPLISTEPILAQIGMKEGITEDSKFEVLEVVEDEEGRLSYERVGTLSPVKNLIWDNRFMASEEKAPGADLGATTFKKTSGKDLYPGMLIREIK